MSFGEPATTDRRCLLRSVRAALAGAAGSVQIYFMPRTRRFKLTVIRHLGLDRLAPLLLDFRRNSAAEPQDIADVAELALAGAARGSWQRPSPLGCRSSRQSPIPMSVISI